MLKIGLTNQPEWLDLPMGVRIKVAPMTTSLMLEVRRDPAIRRTNVEDRPDEEIGMMLAIAMAKAAILDWEGVGDADGDPIPVSKEAIESLMDVFQIFDAFQEQYVSRGLLLEQEKNASAPSPNGSTAGAENTAKRAKRSVKPAPKH